MLQPGGPCGSGTSLHEKLLELPFRVRALHPALRMLGLKTVESTNGAHPKMGPNVLATQTHFLPFSDLFCIYTYLFVTSSTLMFQFRRSDSHMVQSVCGKGNCDEDDIGNRIQGGQGQGC